MLNTASALCTLSRSSMLRFKDPTHSCIHTQLVLTRGTLRVIGRLSYKLNEDNTQYTQYTPGHNVPNAPKCFQIFFYLGALCVYGGGHMRAYVCMKMATCWQISCIQFWNPSLNPQVLSFWCQVIGY